VQSRSGTWHHPSPGPRSQLAVLLPPVEVLLLYLLGLNGLAQHPPRQCPALVLEGSIPNQEGKFSRNFSQVSVDTSRPASLHLKSPYFRKELLNAKLFSAQATLRALATTTAHLHSACRKSVPRVTSFKAVALFSEGALPTNPCQIRTHSEKASSCSSINSSSSSSSNSTTQGLTPICGRHSRASSEAEELVKSSHLEPGTPGGSRHHSSRAVGQLLARCFPRLGPLSALPSDCA